MHALGVRLLRRIMRWLGDRSERMLRTFIVAMSAVHLVLLRISGWRIGRRLGLTEAIIVVLTTTGRRSNLPREVPLLALQDGKDYVVAASHGGLDSAPAWFHNLMAHPEAVVGVDGRSQSVRAELVPEDQQAAMWARFVRAFPGYSDYQARSHRRIPMLVLHPVD